jgi:hypothetical protein
MSQVEPKPVKPRPPAESDLSQILAHAPACREAYGPFLGAVIMLFAMNKARRGVVGVATAASIVGTIVYHVFWK